MFWFRGGKINSYKHTTPIARKKKEEKVAPRIIQALSQSAKLKGHSARSRLTQLHAQLPQKLHSPISNLKNVKLIKLPTVVLCFSFKGKEFLHLYCSRNTLTTTACLEHYLLFEIIPSFFSPSNKIPLLADSPTLSRLSSALSFLTRHRQYDGGRPSKETNATWFPSFSFYTFIQQS